MIRRTWSPSTYIHPTHQSSQVFDAYANNKFVKVTGHRGVHAVYAANIAGGHGWDDTCWVHELPAGLLCVCPDVGQHGTHAQSRAGCQEGGARCAACLLPATACLDASDADGCAHRHSRMYEVDWLGQGCSMTACRGLHTLAWPPRSLASRHWPAHASAAPNIISTTQT